MQAPGCGGGGIQGTHTGNSQKAPTWGSWRFLQSLLAFAKSILILCYLKGKQLVLPRLFPPPPPLVFPIGLGPYQFIRVGGPARSPAAGGLREALVTRLTTAPCSSFWGHCPAQGPWHIGLPPSLCSTASGKLLSAPVDLITAGPIPHDTMRS